MALQLTGAAKKDPSPLQLRLPIVVNRRRPDRIDYSDRSLAYYPVQVENFSRV